MTRHVFVPLAIGLLLFSCSPATPDKTDNPKVTPTSYDAALAQELGADEFGMRSYVFVTLKTGPNDAMITNEAQRADLFSGHFSNMGRLAEEGKLVLAGPFMGAAPKRGMYIFDVTTLEEAQALVETDPAIAAGIFTAEYDLYYGSAALKQVNDLHLRIQKTQVE